MGAIKKTIILELLGRMVSFTNSFSPSAKGCSKPKKPITFGPFLLCMIPIIFLSAIVKYATEINNGITIARILRILHIIVKIIFIKLIKVKTGFEPIFQDLQSNTLPTMLFNLKIRWDSNPRYLL